MNIKSILFVILIISIVSSCEKEQPLEADTSGASFFSNIEVTVIECDDTACANIITPSGITIRLYQTENDALEGIGLINDAVTDSGGKAYFTSLDAYDGVFVRVDYQDQVYISYNSLGVDVIAYHDVIFIPGLSYDFNDVLERNQNHISFREPLVSHTSTYRYHYSTDRSFNIYDLDTVKLKVRIEDKISDNIFLVSEELSSQPEDRFTEFPEQSLNQWEFTSDSLIVTPVGISEVSSCLFGYGYSGAGYTKRFALAINPPQENPIDFDDYLYYTDVDWEYYMYMEDEVFLNKEYDLLHLNLISFQGGDGHLQLRVFNENDGLVRYLGYDAWSSNGFGWVLETD